MPKLKALAPAKINLTFDILGTMPDGYHEVETLLHSVDLIDTIEFDIEEADTCAVTITAPDAPRHMQFPLSEDNLIARAVRLFSQSTGRNATVQARVEKLIPIGAGLAGGSADAAATLVAMNAAFGEPLSMPDLLRLGGSLGADVPFAIIGGTAIGTARGDVLTPRRCAYPFAFCIVKPIKISVSTPWAYQRFDVYSGNKPRPNTRKAAAALEEGAIDQAIPTFGNVFEPVIFQEHPLLSDLKSQLQKYAPWHVQLSGSGPALFAIVSGLEQAHFIRRKILKTDDAGFMYGSGFPVNEFGPPIEFHICTSSTSGAQVTG